MTTKPRKHKFVSQCIQEDETTMTVWPSPGEKLEDYQGKVTKITNDPRVVNVENVVGIDHGIKFTIDKTKV